ncbi:MAG: ATP synthase F1 subunit epsilon [Sandaracinus sp.]|nr:ATP synthase F1 subunit epsilon [Sandaracinus sp.]|tara:strand:+ start:467 stop:895 length:429 start_codon:yes stop_codon:yes gene_type:complete
MALNTILTLEVATPKGLALRTEADSVQVPSSLGEFGVLPGHVPVLAALKSGILRWHRAGGGTEVAAIGPGFAQAEPASVQILTDLFARASDVDVAAVKKEREEAEKALKAFDGNAQDAGYQELLRAIEWAQARLDAAASTQN